MREKTVPFLGLAATLLLFAATAGWRCYRDTEVTDPHTFNGVMPVASEEQLYSTGEVDNKGRLTDGTEFTGHQGLKELIAGNRKDQFLRNIAKKMLSFALGRELKLHDEITLEEIKQNLRKNNYSSHTLLESVVLSYPFRYRKEPSKKGAE